MYARAFFDLQLAFARTASILSGVPLARAVLDYTNCYIRFGLGRDFDPAHPAWQAYAAGLQTANDAGDWTYRFYLGRPPGAGAPPVVATFGCFSYARLGGDRLRLHFLNAETDGHSPLAKDRRDRRTADLAALFTHVRRTQPDPIRVVGSSWLYNLEAYRRLFPISYLATARVAHHRFRHMPLWGQFVDRHGEVRPGLAREFRERLGRETTLEGLEQCFPFPVLSVEADVRDFYEFHGI
jgi:hypothetical protein